MTLKPKAFHTNKVRKAKVKKTNREIIPLKLSKEALEGKRLIIARIPK